MIQYHKRDFLEYMADVRRYSGSLLNLNEQWDNIKLLCEINCPGQSRDILPDMDKIQNSFFDLQGELIETLTGETLKNLEQKMVSKAQVAVDILIRNLYERTADVGFLATDDEVRRFVQLDEPGGEARRKMLTRLGEYVAKYSVYEEIVILDTDFNVLVNFDPDNPIAGCAIDDPLLQETLDCTAGFVETFRKSPLQPNKDKAHIFSCKVCAEDSGALLGVICLCFKFENEMERIFKKLAVDYDGSVIMIIDGDSAVLASSDENHVPEGITVEPVPREDTAVVYYRGMEYLSKTVYTQGYQGYFGLGWKGHVMIPLRLAFREKNANALEKFDQALIAGLMSKADSFSKALHEIIRKTAQINGSLRRIVYNGQLIAREDGRDDEYGRLRPLLRSISRMGAETSQLFEKSVRELFSTVISAGLRDVRFLASLCIDIMDRNLYERADDCRWWALNATFRRLLASDALTGQDCEKLTGILTYIHTLYTVYSNLFLYDRSGTIVAVSNPAHASDVGKKLNRQYVRDVLANADGGKYYVSDFEASDLYNGKYTYIYSASVTDIRDPDRTVGGIGIVFDSEFQFNAMLRDAVSSGESSFAVFTDRNGLIIAATRADLTTGTRLTVPGHLLKTANGAADSELFVYDNNYYAVGCACSSSYREYKSTDGYQNDVLAFVFQKLADYEQTAATETAVRKSAWLEQTDVSASEHDGRVRLATFAINQQILALDQTMVLEALDAESIVRLPIDNELVLGAVWYRDQYVAVVDMHAVFDRTDAGAPSAHVLVVQLGDGKLAALAADEIHNVMEVGESAVKAAPQVKGMAALVRGIVSYDQGGKGMAFILDVENLLERLDLRMLRLELEKTIQALEETEDNNGAG